MHTAAELNAPLQRAASARKALAAVDAELRAVDAQLAKIAAGEQRWRRQAGAAAGELRALHGFGPGALWQRVRGRAAALRAAAQARIDEARREQDALDERAAPLQTRRAALLAQRTPLAVDAAAYAAAASAKAAWLRAFGGALAARLDASAAALEEVARQQRVVDAAIARAREAESALIAARDQLGEVRTFGRRAVGFGVARSAQQHSGITTAQGHLQRAQRHLQALGADAGAELDAIARAVGGAGAGRVHGAVGATVAGLLLAPGVFTWLAGARAAEARTEVAAVLERVRDRVLGLEQLARSLHAAHRAAAAEREAWIETTDR